MDIRNYFKCRVLYFLADSIKYIDEAGEGIAWYTPANIAHCTGTNPGSCQVILHRWRKASWGYVDAIHYDKHLCDDNREHYFFRINNKGLYHFNKRMSRWYPDYKAAIKAVDQAEEGIRHRMVKPRSVVINVPGWNPKYHRVMDYSICLRWPFSHAVDVQLLYHSVWNGRDGAGTYYYMAGDLEAAVEVVIKDMYKLVPGKDVIQRAVAIEKELRHSIRTLHLR